MRDRYKAQGRNVGGSVGQVATARQHNRPRIVLDVWRLRQFPLQRLRVDVRVEVTVEVGYQHMD